MILFRPLTRRCVVGRTVSLATLVAGLLAGSFLAGLATASAPDAETIWIEAEGYSASNFSDQWEVTSMGKPELLSGGQWLSRGVGKDEVAGIVPPGGVTLKYSVPVNRPGDYRLWARLGWFRSRADCQWRLGDGPWHNVSHEAPTTNLMEVGFFTEVSWSDLGNVRLDESTVLEIRYPRVSDGKSRMLMALDCFAFAQGDFLPDGPFQPGQTYDDPADRAAADNVFTLPFNESDARNRVELTGPWQVARFDDPDMDRGTYEPIRELPAGKLRWMGFDVPGNPWKKAPLVFGHRLMFRTKVRIPRASAGRSFLLHFSGTNWIASVFVNGRLAGTHKGVWVPWDLDITKYVRPGETNELAVAVKGTYYAFDMKAMGGGTIHAARNRPLSRQKWTKWVAPMYPSTKGDGDGYQYGIVNPVTLVCAGPTYTADIFVKPSVRRHALNLEYTLRNVTDAPQTVQILAEAVNDRTGNVEASWPLPNTTVDARRQAKIVSGDLSWKEPKLWWPKPDPDLYRLRMIVKQNDRILDVHEQTFGFREITIEGTGLLINGVRRNLWNWVDVARSDIKRPEDWVEAWRSEGSRFMRFSYGRKITQVLKTREDRLDFYDRNGVPGRLCTMIDGMFISYRLLDRTGSGNERKVAPNKIVWENFREHMAQVARAYRNHPSIFLYQAENELVYINGMNIYGSDLGLIEDEMNQVIEAGRAFDSTRPFTVGGGGDLSGRLEINAPHYPTASLDWYPENAYSIDHYATKIERWPWDRSKPWQVGECSFANHVGYGTLVAGSAASRSKQHAREAKAKYLRMLYGGYRWAGVSAFFPWDNLSEFDDAQMVFSDLCVIARKQTHRLFSGRANELLFKVMNDTLSDQPVTLGWSYQIGNQTVAQGSDQMRIKPGFGREVTLTIEAPKVAARTPGTLQIHLAQGEVGKFDDRWEVPILPTGRPIKAAGPLFVYERRNDLADYLRTAGLIVQSIRSLDELADRQGMLLVGPDRLSAEEAFGPQLLAFAVRGGRVICLEQATPASGAALPAPIRPTTRFGGYAHPSALGTPVFRDMGAEDLIDWEGDHPTYREAYQKPSQGARVMAVAGSSLELSPLLEVPCGKGVMVLCQLRVGAKLNVDPAANILLRNLLEVYGTYRPADGVTSVYAPGNTLLSERVNATGVLFESVETLADALDANRYRAFVLDATPENLAALRSLSDSVERFQDAGGWVMLVGVTREGLTAFNRLVGGTYQLRPFRLEKVTLSHNEHPLAATLSDADVAMLSPEQIMHSTYWVSPNTFSTVIDAGKDFAPFTCPPGAPLDSFIYKPTRDDHDPYNLVNGLMADDSWRYTRQFWIGEDGRTEDLVFKLHQPDRLESIVVGSLDTYGTFTELDVIIDGDAGSPIHMTLPPVTQIVTLRLPEPVDVRESITLHPRRWALKGRLNGEGGEIRLAGVNFVSLLRPAEPVDAVSIDSAGGLVAFPRRSGGYLLNQIKFMENEPKSANDARKTRLLGTILGNMGIGFRTASRIAVPGVNVRFQPVLLQEYGNAFLDKKRGENAWFGEPGGADLALLPRGRSTLNEIPFHVTDYATAPTPDVVILGGTSRRWNPTAVRALDSSVTGIPVGQKADMIYLLHTAHVSGPVTDRERSQMNDARRPFQLPVVMKYLLHYRDGQTREIPVTLETNIEHWIQEEPKSLSGARVAWHQRLPALNGSQAVLYSMQAANPRPEIEISSIDVRRTSDRAVPAVLAITLGEIIE